MGRFPRQSLADLRRCSAVSDRRGVVCGGELWQGDARSNRDAIYTRYHDFGKCQRQHAVAYLFRCRRAIKGSGHRHDQVRPHHLHRSARCLSRSQGFYPRLVHVAELRRQRLRDLRGDSRIGPFARPRARAIAANRRPQRQRDDVSRSRYHAGRRQCYRLPAGHRGPH